VPSPVLRLPASHSTIASTQTSSTNGFGCKRSTALQPAFIPLRVPLAAASLHPTSSNICVEIRHPRDLSSRPSTMIRIDNLWLATEPMDMRAGTDTALARVIAVFGAAQPHCAYLFATRRANRMKVLVHELEDMVPSEGAPS